MRSIRREGGTRDRYARRRTLIQAGARGPASHALAGVHLQDVALGEVVEAVQDDAALEAVTDFVHVVFEAAQGGDVAFPDLLAAALHANAVAAVNHAIGDRAARHGATAGLDRLADHGVAVDDLLVAWLEHAGEHLLDVFDQCVDDAVFADAHTLELGRAFGVGFDADVEGNNHRLRRVREVDVVDVDVPEPRVDHLGSRLRLVAELLQ